MRFWVVTAVRVLPDGGTSPYEYLVRADTEQEALARASKEEGYPKWVDDLWCEEYQGKALDAFDLDRVLTT